MGQEKLEIKKNLGSNQSRANTRANTIAYIRFNIRAYMDPFLL